MQFEEIMSFLASNTMTYIFIAFLIGSYLLVSLLTWSFIKPLKYLGISSLIAGTLLLGVRYGFQILIENEIASQGDLEHTLGVVMDYGFGTFSKFSIYFVLTGIVAIVASVLLKKIDIHDKDALITKENIKEL